MGLAAQWQCMSIAPDKALFFSTKKYGKCSKISNTIVSDKMTYANSTDPDQTAPEGESDQGLHCLPFH